MHHTSAKNLEILLVKKKFDAYGELTALVMEQHDWWNRFFHSYTMNVLMLNY
jgi:hypothetical protein